MTGAPWRIGKAYDVGYAVFKVEHLGDKEFRHVMQRFSTFDQAVAAFRTGDAAA